MTAEILIVLPSIHDVLAVEDRVLAAGLWVDVLPKPTAIANDCGMVLGCRAADLEVFGREIRAAGIAAVGVYRVTGDGYECMDALSRA
jgi:hypothetical protein